MQVRTTIKNKVLRYVAIIASAIFITEIIPFPGSVTKVKAAEVLDPYVVVINDTNVAFGSSINYSIVANEAALEGLEYSSSDVKAKFAYGDDEFWYGSDAVYLPVGERRITAEAVYYVGADEVAISYSSYTINVTKGKGVFSLNSTTIKPGEKISVKDLYAIYKGEKLDLVEFGAYSLMYKKQGADDSTYTSTAPTEAGTYVVKAVGKESNSFNSEIINSFEFDTVSFQIEAEKEGKVSLSVGDVVYGQKPNVVLTSSDYDVSKATIEYKKSGAGDATYSTNVPTELGKYVVRATFPKSGNVLGTTVTGEFNITKANGVGSVKVGNSKVGQKITVNVESSTNGNSNVKIYYKVKGADDSTYTATVPTTAGDYVVKAVFPENDYYKETVATAEFNISYSEKVNYELEGTKGDNSFYTSDVKIVPAKGYQISTSSNTGFKDSLTLSKSTKGLKVYFKNKESGSITDGVTVENILIDKDAPIIENLNESTEIYSDKFELNISDDNLYKILINNKEQEFAEKDVEVSLELEATNPVNTYTVTIKDKAGNTTTKRVTVYQEWMKDRKIVAGKKLKLLKGYDYSLSSGDWTVDGDDTVYAGGMKVYVSEEMELVFNQ